MLKVTREVQAVISAATPGGGGVAAGVAAAFQPASQQLQSLENLMKHNDRCLASLFWHAGKWRCLKGSAQVWWFGTGEDMAFTCLVYISMHICMLVFG